MSEVPVIIQKKEAPEGKKHLNQKYHNLSFKGRDLVHADFRSATLYQCDFEDTDLSYANFRGANCWGSNFTGVRLYRTDFGDANLSGTIMNPKDCFGITLTLTCDTFLKMKPGPKWVNMWLYLTLLMDMPDEDQKLKLINVIGPERYIKLRQLFENRQI